MSAHTAASVRGLYDALEGKSPATLPQFFAPDLTFHVIRPMRPKTYRSREEMLRYLAEVRVVSPQDADIRLERLAVDGDFVFAIHVESEGTVREHRHVMIYRFEGDSIKEAWEMTLGGEPNKEGLLGEDPALRPD
jgi:hypothetical protein